MGGDALTGARTGTHPFARACSRRPLAIALIARQTGRWTATETPGPQPRTSASDFAQEHRFPPCWDDWQDQPLPRVPCALTPVGGEVATITAHHEAHDADSLATLVAAGVLAAAREITLSNDDDGVAVVIERRLA